MIINNNEQLEIDILKKVIKETSCKDEKLHKILSEHPEILTFKKQPDTYILYYYLKEKSINSSELAIEEFVDNMIPLSTIRNHRRAIVKKLFKQHGITLNNEATMRDKDAYVRENYLREE